jgi:hypothetical protein
MFCKLHYSGLLNLLFRYGKFARTNFSKFLWLLHDNRIVFEYDVLSAFILSVFLCFLRFQQYDVSPYISQLVYTLETVYSLCGTNSIFKCNFNYF